ncbi:MAG: PEP-CTERM sorting domain-containing protein [Bryobacteraceae bacterium]|jgi:hypothetical protein
MQSRRLFSTAAVLSLALLGSLAHADQISISFIQDGPVAPGGSVDFSVDLTNNTSGTLFLNGSSAVGAFPLSVDDFKFFIFLFANRPVSLNAGNSLNNIDALTVMVDSSAIPGAFGGDFKVTGGASETSSDLLGSGDFQVDVTAGRAAVPEPALLWLTGLGLASICFWKRRGHFR